MIAIRAGHVAGQRLTCCGSGMSISPATGSATGWVTAWASEGLAKGSLRRGVTAAAAVTRRHRAEQAAKLRCGALGRAERQHRHAELARPGEHAFQPLLRCLFDALAHTVAADLELDLQLA